MRECCFRLLESLGTTTRVRTAAHATSNGEDLTDAGFEEAFIFWIFFGFFGIFWRANHEFSVNIPGIFCEFWT
jgi:hypothetical protein